MTHSTTDPTPDAGHAAETIDWQAEKMTDRGLIENLAVAYREFCQSTELDTPEYYRRRDEYEAYRVEMLRRLDSAPARTEVGDGDAA